MQTGTILIWGYASTKSLRTPDLDNIQLTEKGRLQRLKMLNCHFIAPNCKVASPHNIDLCQHLFQTFKKEKIYLRRYQMTKYKIASN